MPRTYAQDEAPLPRELVEQLAARGVAQSDEVALRRTLEALVPGYSVYRLTPAAQKRWKCRYRIMLDAGYFDGNSVAEVYGRALLALDSAAAEVGSSSDRPE